jgi:hypothetical protein
MPYKDPEARREYDRARPPRNRVQTPEQMERRREYNRMYWRINNKKRKKESRRRSTEIDDWCRANLGISYAKAKVIRAALRVRAAEAGEDFMDLARKHNVVLRSEREEMSDDPRG